MAAPMSAGLMATLTPAAFRSAMLLSAVSSPLLTMAPAWPILLPGGALMPAMNVAAGLLPFALT